MRKPLSAADKAWMGCALLLVCAPVIIVLYAVLDFVLTALGYPPCLGCWK